MVVRHRGLHEGTIERFIDQLIENPPAIIGMDIETISLKERAPIGFGIATSPYEAWYFQTMPEYDKEIELIKSLLLNPNIKKVFHNAIFDLRNFPLICDIDTSNIADTNVMARLLTRVDTKLMELAPEVGMTATSAGDLMTKGQTMLDVPTDDVALKCMNDCCVTLALYNRYYEKIDPNYLDVEMKAIPILINMSLAGLHVNQEDRAREEDNLIRDVAYYKSVCQEEDFNPGSGQQVGYILAKRGSFLPFTKGSRGRSNKTLRTDESTLEFLDDPLAMAVLGYRKAQKLLSTYIKPLATEDRIYTEYNLDAVVGRVSSSNRNLQNIPQSKRYIFMPDSGCYTTGDYCLAPNTLVLKSDLSWERIDCLNTEDELISIDEYPINGKGKRRKLLKTKIKRLSLVDKESYRITMVDGRVIEASGEHPWLVMDSVKCNSTAQHPTWTMTKDINSDTKIRQLCSSTWEQDTSYDAAYLAGFFDGEGWIDKSYHMVGFGQNKGATLDLATNKLHSIGFEFTKSKGSSSSTVQYRLTHLSEMLRFIGTVRPPRLLAKSDYLWVGYEPPKLDAWAEVESIESIGVRELVAIETDSHTFVAEGLFTHNSQEHLRILMHLSGDREMQRVYYEGAEGGDIHVKTAKGLNVSRKLAKTINYAIPYGATDKTISAQAKIRDVRRCSRFLDDWFKTYPEATEWIKGAQSYGLRHGVALPTLFGREIGLQMDRYEEDIKRKAVNYPILGSDGEVMKRALIICDKYKLPMVVTMHDSITCDGDIEFPLDELENITPFRLPFEVEKTERWK